MSSLKIHTVKFESFGKTLLWNKHNDGDDEDDNHKNNNILEMTFSRKTMLLLR
jgi:hypothetical protein